MDTNDIHEDDNLEEVEINTELCKLKQLNPEEGNDNEYHKEWRKRTFEKELNNINDMSNIHDNDVKNKSECNLLHDILNTSKRTKNKSCYSPILHGCMNTRRGRG